MIINFNFKNNDFLQNGKLDEQIIADLESYIEEKNRYQKEYLDVRVKTEVPHHYEMWTEQTQLQIKYAERILECVKAQINKEVRENIIIRSFFCNSCEHLNTEQCELCCGCNGQGKHWSPINKELFKKNPHEYIKNLILASSKE